MGNSRVTVLFFSSWPKLLLPSSIIFLIQRLCSSRMPYETPTPEEDSKEKQFGHLTHTHAHKHSHPLPWPSAWHSPWRRHKETEDAYEAQRLRSLAESRKPSLPCLSVPVDKQTFIFPNLFTWIIVTDTRLHGNQKEAQDCSFSHEFGWIFGLLAC